MQPRNEVAQTIDWRLIVVGPCPHCEAVGCEECEGKGELMFAGHIEDVLRVSGVWEQLVNEAAQRSRLALPLFAG